MAEEKPSEDYERINVALFPKDYLRYRMTGEIATDVSDASCSWLLDMKKSLIRPHV
ncbi:MAG: FGGY family carbohydrate kinase [[Clostridium] leptum]